MAFPSHFTKIVCTIGPASQSAEVLESMIRAGMNAARLNCAHGDFRGHRDTVSAIRAASEETGLRVAILADLPGPKIRIGRLVNDPITLNKEDSFILTADERENDIPNRVSVSLQQLPEVVGSGDIIFLNDGYIQLQVERVQDNDVHCRVLVGGELRSHKGVNFPGIDLGVSAITDRDLEALAFAAEESLDAVSISFVQGPEDIARLRSAAADLGYDPFIVAKIERARALDTIDSILELADGLMVARGDLGVEIPIEEIAVAQKSLILKANLLGKPVITATQMLASMVRNRRPTRAEVTDVANAILDGTDCVMLSEEAAIGSYPVEAVAMLARIARVTEAHRGRRPVVDALNEAGSNLQTDVEDLIAMSVHDTVDRLEPTVVVTPTESGATARRIARFRLPVWIVAPSVHQSTCQRLQFTYGVHAVLLPRHPASWEVFTREWTEAAGIARGAALLTQGPSIKNPGRTNRMEIIDLDQVQGKGS